MIYNQETAKNTWSTEYIFKTLKLYYYDGTSTQNSWLDLKKQNELKPHWDFCWKDRRPWFSQIMVLSFLPYAKLQIQCKFTFFLLVVHSSLMELSNNTDRSCHLSVSLSHTVFIWKPVCLGLCSMAGICSTPVAELLCSPNTYIFYSDSVLK